MQETEQLILENEASTFIAFTKCAVYPCVSYHTVVITIKRWAISATLSRRLGAILRKFSLTKSHDGKM